MRYMVTLSYSIVKGLSLRPVAVSNKQDTLHAEVVIVKVLRTAVQQVAGGDTASPNHRKANVTSGLDLIQI